MLRGGTVLTLDAQHTRAARRRRARHRRPRRRRRARPRRARRHPGDRRARRHRDARHDRHPPAHVADGDARLRRRLDAHPVLRLVLPRVRQALPPAGRARGQPARRRRGARRGRHHVRRLVARPADRRARRGRGRRAAPIPGRYVLAYGNIQQAPWEWSAVAGLPGASRRRMLRRRPARASRWPSTSPATRRSPRRPRTRWRASSACPSPRTRACGARPTTTASGSRTRRGFIDDRASCSCTRPRSRPTPTTASRPPAAPSRCPPRASRAPGQGYPPTWALRAHDIPVSLSMDTSVWWSGDLFSAMRTTLGADRSREHFEAHQKGDTDHPLLAARRARRRLGHPRRRRTRSAAPPTWAASSRARRPTSC